MKTAKTLLSGGMLLAALAKGVGQPIITTQPQNQTNVLGSNAIFSVMAEGTSPLSFQWRSYSGTGVFIDIMGQTNDTLILTNVQPSAANFRYAMVVSDATGSATSMLARLTMLIPPTITVPPVSQTVEV